MKGVYLGNTGSVEIERSSLNVPLASMLDADDVNVPAKRFSFDFVQGALISGDKVEIATQDPSQDLELIANHPFPDWEGYIHVDDAGGIRLFTTYEKGINGVKDEALELISPTISQGITVKNVIGPFRFVSQIQEYSLTTSRSNIDLTSIGDEFTKSYASGLITGQGTLTCFWDYQRELCQDDCPKSIELSHYFAELVIRTQLGSSFIGRFNIVLDPVTKQRVWWDAPICIVTNVAMSFVPTEPLRTRINFVISGPVRLRVGQPPAYLMMQDDSFLLQEDDERIGLEDDDD